jgi:hypothetical protein
MVENRKGAHTVHNIQYHLVWVTKYPYQVPLGARLFLQHDRGDNDGTDRRVHQPAR